jgi:hypothetical protein
VPESVDRDPKDDASDFSPGAGCVTVLDGDSTEALGIGFAGARGFGGGFAPQMLNPWGEPIIKAFVQETLDQALRLEKALSRLETANMQFQISCRLAYEVLGSASFLFNVAAVQNSLQQVTTEDFHVAGAESCQELLVGGRRFHRVLAQTGRLELTYGAVVDVNPEILQPQRLNIPLLHEIPSEALVYLYPSRFCQSDLLARFAMREFS